MILREELEPQLLIAEKLYPAVLKLILDYTEQFKEYNDDNNTKYINLEDKVFQLTGKDTSKFNLWEWWEEEGAETLAYRLALPVPCKINKITRHELTEIVGRLKSLEYLTDNLQSNIFSKKFSHCLQEYYFDFLKINYKKYNYNLFNRRKDDEGNYCELSVEEIVHRLWNK